MKKFKFLILFVFIGNFISAQFFVDKEYLFSNVYGLIPNKLVEDEPFRNKIEIAKNGDIVIYSEKGNFLEKYTLISKLEDVVVNDYFKLQEADNDKIGTYKNLRGDIFKIIVFNLAGLYGYRIVNSDGSYTHFFNSKTMPNTNPFNEALKISKTPHKVSYTKMFMNNFYEMGANINAEFTISFDEINGFLQKGDKKIEMVFKRDKAAKEEVVCEICSERKYTFLDSKNNPVKIIFYKNDSFEFIVKDKSIRFMK